MSSWLSCTRSAIFRHALRATRVANEQRWNTMIFRTRDTLIEADNLVGEVSLLVRTAEALT